MTGGGAGAALPPRRRADGRLAADYAWRVAPGGVLVVEDRAAAGWRSVTDDAPGWRHVANDAPGVLRDLREWRPDLLRRVPLVVYRRDGGTGTWDALRADARGGFAGHVGLGCATEAEAVARVLALASGGAR